MRPYPKYKDSGVEWIGQVPEGWGCSLLKRYSKVTDGSHFSPKTVLEGRPYISVKDVDEQGINFKDCKQISEEDFEQLRKNGCSPEIGDVLLTKDGTIGRGVVVQKEWPEFVVLSSLGILTPSAKLESSYLLFYLLSGLNIQQMLRTIHGSALTRLTIEKINDLIICIPPYKEQTAIANYLDRKTAEIDRLVANKERLIELYKEEKTTVINQAVTKGLDPDAPMKPSSIDWLGDIPERWESKKIKYVAWLRSGNGITSDQIKDYGDYPVYGGNGLRGFSNSYTHDGSNVLIGRQGALCGNINYAYGKFWASEHAVVATFNGDYELVWFGELLRIMNLNQYSMSAAQPGLSVDNIKNLLIPVPPKAEQTAIVQHIETECSRLDAIIDKFKKQIELLKEYRTTLISEVVTGKIDVRGETLS